MKCPECDGAGVIDNSPAAVTRAPWLQSDRTCWNCDGMGEADHRDPSDADTDPVTVTAEDVAAYTAALEAHVAGLGRAS